MATVTRENIGLLNDKLTVNLMKDDYLPVFQQSLKKYAKSANLPGFRKGMVPSGLIKKMYGQNVFTEEILRIIEKELNAYLAKEQPDIFAQPLPLESDARMLDVNDPRDYAFSFEIGLKPSFEIDIDKISVIRYKIEVTDEMLNDETDRLKIRHGKITEPETITTGENILNVQLTETDKEGNETEGGISKSNSLLLKYFSDPVRTELESKKKDDSIILQISTAFDEKEREWVMSDLGLNIENAGEEEKFFKMTITKIGLVEKPIPDEEFFEKVYPGKNIKTEEEFRNTLKAEIEAYNDNKSRKQMHDQIYHYLIDHIQMDFPESFLKRWLLTGNEKPKTAEEAETEYPPFLNQLKWSLISSKLLDDNKIIINPDEIREAAMQHVSSYLGVQAGSGEKWLEDYADRMVQDRKFMESSYFRLQNDKLFSLLEGHVQQTEQTITEKDFAEKLHHHH